MTAPGAAEETLDCAAETLETVVVQFSPGGGGGGGGGGTCSASTVQLRLAGVGSTLPAPSVARTEKVWDPTARPERALGEAHAAQLALSSLQAKVEPDSLAEKPQPPRVRRFRSTGTS